MSKTNLDYVSILSRDSVVADGNIIVPSHLKISGQIKMNLESAGKIVVTETGVIEGNIQAPEVHVHGKVKGDRIRADLLVIYSTAEVTGRILVNRLGVEQGAVCNSVLAVGEKTVKRFEAEEQKAVKDDRREQSKQQEKAAVIETLPAVTHSEKQLQRETRNEKKVRENGRFQDSETTRENKQTTAPEKKTIPSKIDKSKGDLPRDKEWIDRFW